MTANHVTIDAGSLTFLALADGTGAVAPADAVRARRVHQLAAAFHVIHAIHAVLDTISDCSSSSAWIAFFITLSGKDATSARHLGVVDYLQLELTATAPPRLAVALSLGGALVAFAADRCVMACAEVDGHLNEVARGVI